MSEAVEKVNHVRAFLEELGLKSLAKMQVLICEQSRILHKFCLQQTEHLKSKPLSMADNITSTSHTYYSNSWGCYCSSRQVFTYQHSSTTCSSGCSQNVNYFLKINTCVNVVTIWPKIKSIKPLLTEVPLRVFTQSVPGQPCDHNSKHLHSNKTMCWHFNLHNN